MARVGLDLAAQPVHVDVHGAGLAGVVVAPDVLEQLVAREDLAGMAEQEGEQVEGLGLDGQRLAVAQEPMAGQVHLDAGRGRSTGGPRPRPPAARGAAAGPGRGPAARAG